MLKLTIFEREARKIAEQSKIDLVADGAGENIWEKDIENIHPVGGGRDAVGLWSRER